MDTAAANIVLAATFGPDRATHVPDTCVIRLWVGDPDTDGVEQSGPGYAAVTVSMDDWPAYAALVDGSTSVLVDFADATGEWPDDCTHYTVEVGGSVVFSNGLAVPVEVGGAGSIPPVLATVFFNVIEEF
jgi:hypothetical protein